MSVQNYLKHAMKRTEITQCELSRATGVKQQTLSRILTGEAQQPRYETAKKLANYFGDDLETFYGENNYERTDWIPGPEA